METTHHMDARTLAERLRVAIAEGELPAGSKLPTIGLLAEQYGVNKNTVSSAVQQLKSEGVLTGVAGGPTRVRVQPPFAVRHNLRYRAEKQQVHSAEEERASEGTSELTTGISVHELHANEVELEEVEASEDVAEALRLPVGARLLQRRFVRLHAEGAGMSRSISYLPYELVAQNPDLLDPNNEPWPGGTQHQLHTVGVEVGRIDDHVTASMPTPDEVRDMDIPPGVPIMRIRKITYDVKDQPVEVVDIPAPADRTKLVFTTELERWQ